MLTRDQSAKLAETALKLSTFPECSIAIVSEEQAYTRFANNGVTTAALSLRNTAIITAVRDGRAGTSTTGDLEESALRAAVRQAEQLATIAPPNPERAAALGPQQYPTPPRFDERTASARSTEMIPHIKTVIDAARERKLIAAGLMERTRTTTAIANKNGLFGFHESADAGLTSTIRMPDGSSSGWAGHPSTNLGEIDSARVAAAAIDKCLRWKNPQRLDPGNYTVVLEPTAAGDLVRLIAPGFNARASEEGRTFLSKRGGGTRLGEKMFPDFITLRTDPFDPRMASSPWTGESVPTRSVRWIDKGTVANHSYDRYWAARSNQQPTPNPGTALILDGGAATLDELIASVERGLLVTHFWYIRFVNQQTLQQTGLTRDGLFLIENGKIAAAVSNFRFNESPVRLLQNTQRLGASLRVRGLEGGMMIAPPLLATDFPFTSISDAV